MKEKKTSIGCLFWIALILLILVIFLFNRNTIETVLDNTGFLELFTTEGVDPEIERIEDQGTNEETPDKQIVQEVSPAPQPIEKDVEVLPALPEVEFVANTEIEIEEEKPLEAKLRKSRLYFAQVDEEGNISLKGINRPIYYSDSPLTETLVNLLKGLSTTEINEGLLSLIPEGTTLLSASVRAETAYLNFSENFLFNPWGIEGYTAQLEQVVFTTLEFSTVKSVQILINDEKKDFMGIEGGPYIGAPLNKDSF